MGCFSGESEVPASDAGVAPSEGVAPAILEEELVSELTLVWALSSTADNLWSEAGRGGEPRPGPMSPRI